MMLYALLMGMVWWKIVGMLGVGYLYSLFGEGWGRREFSGAV
jgi:hypothetical protein